MRLGQLPRSLRQARWLFMAAFDPPLSLSVSCLPTAPRFELAWVTDGIDNTIGSEFISPSYRFVLAFMMR